MDDAHEQVTLREGLALGGRTRDLPRHARERRRETVIGLVRRRQQDAQGALVLRSPELVEYLIPENVLCDHDAEICKLRRLFRLLDEAPKIIAKVEQLFEPRGAKGPEFGSLVIRVRAVRIFQFKFSGEVGGVRRDDQVEIGWHVD
jgi:hypothetical protein